MKLSNVKNLGFLIEGVVPVTTLMTLREVVNSGKVTNTVQVFLIAALVQFLKNEEPSTIRNINEYHPMAADIEIIKNLQAEDQVSLAQWLIDTLTSWTSTPRVDLHNPTQDLIDWINLVLRKQD